jgi:Arc/MetJ-type ribon-helix-helix transcriptional regulator
MKVELSPETEAYIEASVRSGAFATASEFVEAAARRQMQEESWFEQKVLEGLGGSVSPLTKEDLESVRGIVSKARDRKTA